MTFGDNIDRISLPLSEMDAAKEESMIDRLPKDRHVLGSFEKEEDFWEAHERAQTQEEVAGVLHGGCDMIFSSFNPGSGYKTGSVEMLRLFLGYAERGYGDSWSTHSERQADHIIFFKLLPHINSLGVVYGEETEKTLALFLEFLQRILAKEESIDYRATPIPFHGNNRRLLERAKHTGVFLKLLHRGFPWWGSEELKAGWEDFHKKIDATTIHLGIFVPDFWDKFECRNADSSGATAILREIALGTFSYPYGAKSWPVFPYELDRYNSPEEAIREDPLGRQGRAAWKLLCLQSYARERAKRELRLKKVTG